MNEVEVSREGTTKESLEKEGDAERVIKVFLLCLYSPMLLKRSEKEDRPREASNCLYSSPAVSWAASERSAFRREVCSL